MNRVKVRGPRNPNRTIIQHCFLDLKRVSPLQFSFLLKECYCLGKAISKFKALQKNVYEAFLTLGLPELPTFVVRCLYIFPIFPKSSDGLTHMILSSFLPLINQASFQGILPAKPLTARLFILSVSGSIVYEPLTMLKILQTFDVRTLDLEKALIDLKAENAVTFAAETITNLVEEYVWKLVVSNHHEIAVGFLHHFSISSSDEKFLLRMIASKRLGSAEKWAYFIGPRLIRILVKEYACLNLWKLACGIIASNNMREEFPEVFYEYRKSVIKKYAKKCLWEFAEQRTKGDPQLIEYLTLTTIELGCSEKADELCARYSLHHLKNVKGIASKRDVFEKTMLLSFVLGTETAKQTLKLGSLNVERIRFIDRSEGLCNATSRILQSDVVGVDCEWKPIFRKGAKPNKVSILQISTETEVFIIDLIKLSYENPEVLDNCLSSIFKSSSVLKIGYDFQCDMKELRRSYGRFGCFIEYKMLLDMPDLFNEKNGGLSALSEKILGLKLDKTMRTSDWERRPLSKSQLEYAALDAASLVHIFNRVRDGVAGRLIKEQWKSKIASHVVRYS